MSSLVQWYYLRKRERFGPVKEAELCALIADGTLNRKSYVWRKGFVDWHRIESVDELHSLASPPLPEIPSYDVTVEKKMPTELPSIVRTISWEEIREGEKIFVIRTGYDRDEQHGSDYGPFSLKDLRLAYDEERINAKSLIFARGMENWKELKELPIYEKITGHELQADDVANDTADSVKEKRVNIRKPFVAQVFFYGSEQFYEGLCRDISVGGMQILTADFPKKVGSKVCINVHPDNSEYSFTAEAKVVRILEGDRGCSLRFKNLSDEAKLSIEAYLSEEE